ncbi:hypothetical protein F4810DRAFT_539699 [Camillea tinctor]|nr:hypothetical protein F4810DRAFT_539699 [Camillea tinctor]
MAGSHRNAQYSSYNSAPTRREAQAALLQNNSNYEEDPYKCPIYYSRASPVTHPYVASLRHHPSPPLFQTPSNSQGPPLLAPQPRRQVDFRGFNISTPPPPPPPPPRSQESQTPNSPEPYIPPSPTLLLARQRTDKDKLPLHSNPWHEAQGPTPRRERYNHTGPQDHARPRRGILPISQLVLPSLPLPVSQLISPSFPPPPPPPPPQQPQYSQHTWESEEEAHQGEGEDHEQDQDQEMREPEAAAEADPIYYGVSSTPHINLLNTAAPASLRIAATRERMSLRHLIH